MGILFKQSNKMEIDINKNKKALYILRAINHQLRICMLELINKNNRMTVSEIYKQLNIEQAVASQHLAILRRAGFVITKREGKFMYYTLSNNFISHFAKTIDQLFSSFDKE